LYPITSIATLYNYYQGCGENECNTNSVINKGNKIILNVIDLAEDEFFNMFYYTSAKYFCVNKANTSNRSIVLGCQTYVSNDSRVHKLSLYNEVIKSFEQNCNVSANNINPAALISLQREVYNTQSLASICGTQLGLSWDQVIANLILGGYIEHGCENSVAIIIFQVNLNYHSCALNVDLTITFQYKVPIFGYILKNVAPPYSNAQEVFPKTVYSSDSDSEHESNKKDKITSVSKVASKKPKYNIQSLANKLKDIEELILDTNDEEFEFSDNEYKHNNSDTDKDD
jgi:hypothetical protein